MTEFPENSPFYQKLKFVEPVDSKNLNKGFQVRHVGQPNIVEIPERVLEDWLALIGAVAGSDGFHQDALEDLLNEMYSYLRG